MMRSRLFVRGSLSGVAMLATLAGTAPRATAQAQSGNTLVYMLHSDTPGVPDLDIRTVRSGFRLFASGDGGSMGFRLSGAFGTKMDNYSPCSNTLYSCQNVRIRNSFNNATNASWFQMEWAFGVPPSEWRKIKKVFPGVANALGNGWSAGSNDMVLGRPNRFGPRDGTLGSLAAGVTSTTDGTCTDFTGFNNAAHPGGVPLLAGSGCTSTWPASGWQGDAPIDQVGWQAQLAAQGANFTWDFWRVPTALKRTDKKFMGTGYSTYGETSDFYQQILGAFGGVVPGGSGAPGLQGFPLGIVIRFESFTFGVPSLSGIQYVQALIINRSADVWKAPIDYDSLYFGLTTGVLLGQQSSQNYYLPKFNTAIYLDRGVTSGVAGGPCTQAFRTPSGVGGCPAAAGNSTGWRNGTAGIVVLKSPLGDFRNKLFTRTNGSIVNAAVTGANNCVVGVDIFCNPAHPNRGDTITFNRGGAGGFGNTDSYTWGSNAQASFGFISGTEANTIAGRDLTQSSTTIQWRTFQNPGYPGAIGIYNKYAPGQGAQPGAAWDWNHDGIPDTLALDTCEKKGCVGLFDTMPGGQINNSGNVGGVLAFGPFKLKAGDTTSFVFAQIGGADSSDTWTQINNAIDLYMNFYLAPEAAPLSKVISTQVTPGSDATGTVTARVTINWSEDAEHWTDQYLTKLAKDMRAAPATAPLGILLADNPRNATTNTPPLDTLILNIANSGNLEAIEIYKSCDGGTTFTNTSNCVGQPTLDDRGKPVGLGFSPYSVFDVTANGGNPPNTFTDNTVQAGKSYLYTIVGKSRGAAFLYNRRIGAIQCGLAGATCVADTIRFVPSIRNVLSKSTTDPNVASVYVPLSNPAGYVTATGTAVVSDPRTTLPVTFTFTNATVAGNYAGVFGNKFTVIRDSIISTKAVRTRVIVQDTVAADTSGGKNLGVGVLNLVKSDTLVRDNHEVFSVDVGSLTVATGSIATVGPVVVGVDTVRTTTTYKNSGGNNGGNPPTFTRPSIGYVIAKGTTPIWLSIFPASASSGNPATVFSLSDYPGFTISAQQSNAGAFNPLSYSNTGPILNPLPSEFQFRGAASIARQKLTAADTIVPRGQVNSYMVQWIENTNFTNRVVQAPVVSGSALDLNAGVGRYEVDWTADPFGTTLGFVLNQTNPTATQNQVVASLLARPVGQTGVVDTTTARLTGQQIEDLVAVKLPFTIKNVTQNHPVQVAMLRRLNNTILLGNGQDTIRITVPADQWVPGDALYFIENVVTDSITPKGTVVTPASVGTAPVTLPSGVILPQNQTVLVTPTLLPGRPTLTFNAAVIGCQSIRNSCNPVPQGTAGATGYLPMYAGDRTQWEYYSGFRPDSRYTFSVVAPVTGTGITAVTDSALLLIRVVPNPFIVFSQYQGTDAGNSRIAFTGLPGTGTLRIYTVAGQFVQQIAWTPADLVGNGDLLYDLRSREGIDIATGLYLWVITAPTNPNDPTSAPLTARGKFVVIRGRAQ